MNPTTSPSARKFAELLGDGPLARVALEASLDSIESPAYIVSESGTALHTNEAGRRKLAGSADELRGELAQAVASIAAAGPPPPPGVLVTALRSKPNPTYFLVLFREPSTFESNIAYAAALWELTPRQRDVLELVAEGFSNKTIAVRLGCTERTVESHLTTIYEKSGVTSRTALVAAMARDRR